MLVSKGQLDVMRTRVNAGTQLATFIHLTSGGPLPKTVPSNNLNTWADRAMFVRGYPARRQFHDRSGTGVRNWL